jgi:hypothetical protein
MPKAPAKKKAAKKNGRGRPTLYLPKYCDMLIGHMAAGKSFESFAGVIGVSRQTIYDWRKAQTDFLDAFKIAETKALLFFEEKGLSALDEGPKDFNTGLWVFFMKARWGWKDNGNDPKEKSLHTVRIELPGQGSAEVISTGEDDGTTS